MTVEAWTGDGRAEGRESGSLGRLGHRSLSQERDAEIEAAAPCLSMLFDESGMALARLASAEDAGTPASSWESVDLLAPDLAGLACSWFNELMRKASNHRAELVDVAVDAVISLADESGECWRLHGRVGLRPLFGHRGPAHHDWHATTDGLSVQVADGTWRLRAHLARVGASSSGGGDQRAQAREVKQRRAGSRAKRHRPRRCLRRPALDENIDESSTLSRLSLGADWPPALGSMSPAGASWSRTLSGPPSQQPRDRR